MCEDLTPYDIGFLDGYFAALGIETPTEEQFRAALAALLADDSSTH